MNRKKISLGLLFLTVALIVAPGAMAATAVDYSPTIQPIFNAHCNGCHPTSGVNLSSYSAVMASTYGGTKIVVSGNANNSILYQAVARTGSVSPMPPGSSLSAADIQSIANWINQGALSAPPTPTPTPTPTATPTPTPTPTATPTPTPTPTATPTPTPIPTATPTPTPIPTPTPSPTGTKTKVTFVVTESVTGKPVQGAVVSLSGLIEANIRKRVTYLHTLSIRTNDTGIAVFPYVPLGNYKYWVSKDDYLAASGRVNVTSNIRVQVKLVAESDIAESD